MSFIALVAYRERLTIGDVDEAACGQQVASLTEVRWAILETEGAISFITLPSQAE